jgi:hypothetical protein
MDLREHRLTPIEASCPYAFAGMAVSPIFRTVDKSPTDTAGTRHATFRSAVVSPHVFFRSLINRLN